MLDDNRTRTLLASRLKSRKGCEGVKSRGHIVGMLPCMWRRWWVNGALFCSISAAVSAQADSWTPDHDGNGFNNSFEHAIDLGELKSSGVSIQEQLGVVPWGFDTKDFYKFVFPGGVNDLNLAVALEEEPDTTIYIVVYYDDGGKAHVSRFQDNENFSIPLSAGVYYIEVATTTGSAKDQNLKYTLEMRPVEIPLPDQGGVACKGAPEIGRVSSLREIEGNLSEGKQTSNYKFHTSSGSRVVGRVRAHQASKRYLLTLTDRLTGARLQLPTQDPMKIEGLEIDPGFYCFEIESVGTSGYGNYKAEISALQAGLFPGYSKNRAQNIIDMELGNLSENGNYRSKSRYINHQNPGDHPNIPTIITLGHFYIIRDWVGTNARNQYYWFNLPGESKVELRLYNLMASARAFIEDDDGNILASTVVVGNSLDPEKMATQSLITTLPGDEQYYVRISYLSNSSPGTSFGVSLLALAP